MKLLLFDRVLCAEPLAAESVTLMTDSALLHPGNPLFVADFAPEFIIDIMAAVTITRLGKSITEKFAHRYFSALTPVARMVPVINGEPVRHGCPTLTDFDNSIVIGESMPLDTLAPTLEIQCAGNRFTLSLDDCRFGQAVELLSRNMTLKMGDIIATGRLPFSLPATPGTRLELTTADSSPLLRLKLK
ncbi:MAG: hypothetical protein K2O00_04005 [Muribaculaceae bacterium]|nr:hypothetical protein [Muribaculaceae bacterium]